MAELRERYAELWARRERARAAFRSGQSARLELERVFDEFGDVASGDALATLAAEHQAARFESQREAARRLLRGVQARVLEARSLPVELELRARERSRRIRVGKRERPAFAWLTAAAAIDSTEGRAELQRGLDRDDAELAPLRAERRARRAEELARLGFATPRAWAEALRPGVDLERWSGVARALLSATEPAWHDALRAAGAGAAVHNGIDLARVLSLPRWASAFSGMLLEPLDSLTETWRVRVSELRGLMLDRAAREEAHPEPFLAAPRVPGELSLRLPVRSTLLDLAAALELGGRALTLGFAGESLPVENRLLGDRSLALAWGWLFADRLSDPAWLEIGPVAARAESFAAEARILRLAALRFAAARTLAEHELAALPAGADPGALADAHAARMRGALTCDWSRDALLRDCRSEPAALDELRAACLAAQVAEQLRERHGRAFWRARACGELAKELWNTGTTYTPEALAAQLDLGPLSPDLLQRA
jgi:hypothetical protein